MKKYFFIICWLLFIGAGLGGLQWYSHTPGKADSKPHQNWPSQSHITLKDRPMLILFAHPYCPCSKASIAELERLMPRLKDKTDVQVVFVQPPGRSLEWVKNDLWEKAKSIYGVKVISDSGYRETDLFGANTSGQVFFFSKTGQKIYSGGLTPSRGHMGDSVGRDHILEWMDGKNVGRKISSVFGCSLREI